MNLLLLILAGAICFLILFSLYTFYQSVRPQRIFSGITPEHMKLPHEKIYFTTDDAIILSAWFIPKEGEKTDKVIILTHGYPAEKGDLLPSFEFLRKEFNLFLFDFRYHGESGGTYTTLGGKEVNDLLSAVNYVHELGMKKIGVCGFSMGGAVALMCLEKTPYINAIVTDSAYARLDLMAYELYKPTSVLKYPLVLLTDLWSRLFLKMSLKSVSPIDSVKESDIPILLIHSKTDQVIPFSHALMLQESLKSNPKAEYFFREGPTHGVLDREYQQTILNFFKKNL